MKHDKHDMQPTVSARRRLIRGAFAAPAVLTLYSGGAIAAKSTALRCVTNQITNAPLNGNATPFIANSNATYMRVQLYLVGGSGTDYYVRGVDLPTNRVGGLPTTSQAQRFDGTPNNSNSGADNGLIDSPISAPANIQPAGQWAVLQVNSSGVVTGVGKSPAGSSAIFQSCWTSAFINPN